MAESRDFSVATYSLVSLNATERAVSTFTGMLGTPCCEFPLTEELLHAAEISIAVSTQPRAGVCPSLFVLVEIPVFRSIPQYPNM